VPVTDHLDFVLAQWARERPDLDVSPMGVIGRISRLSRLLEPELNRTFRAHDLDRPAFDVLATLRRAGPPHRLTPVELMRASMITSGAVTQRLDRLERRGLITRTPSDIDGRQVYVALTQHGLEVIDRALPDHVANEHRLLQALTRGQRRTLTEHLRRLLEALGDTGD
jgi:DNA-binding MarR family transcriptional regulator